MNDEQPDPVEVALAEQEKKVALALEAADDKIRLAFNAADQLEKDRIANSERNVGQELGARLDALENPDEHAPIRAAVNEAIKLTVWRNIRRYTTLAGLGWLTLDMLLTVVVVVLVANASNAADERRARDACRHIGQIAVIERVTVQNNRKATNDLEKRGETFGLSKERFKKLVAVSRKQQDEHLRALNRLVEKDCENI